jgi:hypothetical protein
MVVSKAARASYSVAPYPQRASPSQTTQQAAVGCHVTYPVNSLSFDACNTSLSILNGFIPNSLEYNRIRHYRRRLHPSRPMVTTIDQSGHDRCQNGVFIGVRISPPRPPKPYQHTAGLTLGIGTAHRLDLMRGFLGVGACGSPNRSHSASLRACSSVIQLVRANSRSRAAMNCGHPPLAPW